LNIHIVSDTKLKKSLFRKFKIKRGNMNELNFRLMNTGYKGTRELLLRALCFQKNTNLLEAVDLWNDIG
jgi:hypothetical protein